MTPDQRAKLSYTIAHFQEIARLNRFAENGAFDHDTDRCVVCRPDILPQSPFATYLEVVTQSIKIRRPRLDQDLVDEINKDLALMTISDTISIESLLAGEKNALRYWIGWIHDALSTGLGLLSIHSDTSREFDLEEAGQEELVEAKVKELMEYQRANR
jgi:hypothetical protein